MGAAALLLGCMEAMVRSGLLLPFRVVRTLLQSLALFSSNVDSLLQALLRTLIINHTLYLLVLLLLYLLCPSLLKLAFQLKDYLTLLLLELIRLLLTPCVGDLPPLCYSVLKVAIDILSGSTWLDLLFQYALSDVD